MSGFQRTPLITGSKRSTVTDSAQQLNVPMAVGKLYLFTTTATAYVQQGANPTATAGDASMLVAAGGSLYLSGNEGGKLSVLRASADGECTLTPMVPV